MASAISVRSAAVSGSPSIDSGGWLWPMPGADPGSCAIASSRLERRRSISACSVEASSKGGSGDSSSSGGWRRFELGTQSQPSLSSSLIAASINSCEAVSAKIFSIMSRAL